MGKFHIIVFLVLFAQFTLVYSQYTVTDQSDEISIGIDRSSGIFDSNDILDISLEFDITSFIRKKQRDEYLDAVLTINEGNPKKESFKVRVRARGNSRIDICHFPPIRINLSETETGYSDLDSIKNIKMVTHCKGNRIYEEYLFREYLSYRIYNLVTDFSFRVRLLRIKYIDTGTKERNSESWGFLIEPLDMLEERMNVTEVEDIILRYSYFEPEPLDRMSVFQYMIGNTDWQVATYHNVKVVKREGSILGIVIPYDFDYSGFVNTSYALPAEVLGIKDVKQRVYLGACRDEATYLRTLSEFEGLRHDIFQLLDEETQLGEGGRKYLKNYIESFYHEYKRNRIISIFKAYCKEI